MCRSNKGKNTPLGFSLLEVIFALTTLGLVLLLLFQGLGPVEATQDWLRKHQRIFAARDAVRIALKLQGPDNLYEEGASTKPLFAIIFKEDEPLLTPFEDKPLISRDDTRPEIVVYVSPLDTKPCDNALYVALHPITIRGLVGEAVYGFPFCF